MARINWQATFEEVGTVINLAISNRSDFFIIVNKLLI